MAPILTPSHPVHGATVAGLPTWQTRVHTRSGIHAVRLAVAHTFWRRFRGLMGTAGLPVQPVPHGLLLTDCTSVHGGFMRYALDVVYLSAPVNGSAWITHFARLRPWGASFGRAWDAGAQRHPCRHAVELPAGTVRALHLRAGDRLEWPQPPDLNPANAFPPTASLGGSRGHLGDA